MARLEFRLKKIDETKNKKRQKSFKQTKHYHLKSKTL